MIIINYAYHYYHYYYDWLILMLLLVRFVLISRMGPQTTFWQIGAQQVSLSTNIDFALTPLELTPFVPFRSSSSRMGPQPVWWSRALTLKGELRGSQGRGVWTSVSMKRLEGKTIKVVVTYDPQSLGHPLFPLETRVPLRSPPAGCTHMPGSLSTTRRRGSFGRTEWGGWTLNISSAWFDCSCCFDYFPPLVHAPLFVFPGPRRRCAEAGPPARRCRAAGGSRRGGSAPNICIHICIYIYIYMCTCIYTHVYIHILHI